MSIPTVNFNLFDIYLLRNDCKHWWVSYVISISENGDIWWSDIVSNSNNISAKALFGPDLIYTKLGKFTTVSDLKSSNPEYFI